MGIVVRGVLRTAALPAPLEGGHAAADLVGVPVSGFRAVLGGSLGALAQLWGQVRLPYAAGQGARTRAGVMGRAAGRAGGALRAARGRLRAAVGRVAREVGRLLAPAGRPAAGRQGRWLRRLFGGIAVAGALGGTGAPGNLGRRAAAAGRQRGRAVLLRAATGRPRRDLLARLRATGPLVGDRATVRADQLRRPSAGQGHGIGGVARRGKVRFVAEVGQPAARLDGVGSRPVLRAGEGPARTEQAAPLTTVVVQRDREAGEGVQVDRGLQLDRPSSSAGGPGSGTGVWASADLRLLAGSVSFGGRGRSSRKPMPFVSGTSSVRSASGMKMTAVVPPYGEG